MSVKTFYENGEDHTSIPDRIRLAMLKLIAGRDGVIMNVDLSLLEKSEANGRWHKGTLFNCNTVFRVRLDINPVERK